MDTPASAIEVTMTCQNCGHDNAGWAKTCEHCGQTLEHHAARDAERPDAAVRTAPSVPSTDLQLERAEFDNPAHASTCAMCANPLDREYYQVNDRSMCHRCSELVRASADEGSRVSRGLRAIGAGFAAAIGGSILYYAILALTGYEIGLIAIVVGWGVGRAVSWGARGRGGWFYQTAAVSLTYLAIVSAYVPLIVAEFRKGAETHATAATPGSDRATPVSQPVSAAPESEADDTPPSGGSALLAIVVLVGFLLALPFLGGFENIIGLVIIGIGLYEAWKANKRRVLQITGPHAITTAATVSAQG